MRIPIEQVVFLDQDGVINQDSTEYVKSWDEFHFIPGSLEALRLLYEKGFCVIVITNQSAVGRGMITMKTLMNMHIKMRKAVRKAGGKIYDVFFCPHRPDEHCDCRKPEPGLILQAQEEYGIVLSKSIMVGDNGKDVMAGKNAGVGKTVLVLTGSGAAAQNELMKSGTPPDFVAEDLLDAAKWIIKERLKWIFSE